MPHVGSVAHTCLVGFAFLGVMAVSVRDAAAQTTIYVVRHAEKASEPGTNPPLSEAGKERAVTLARVLRSVKLDVVYSTEYDRTMQTVAPAAAAAAVTVTPYKSEKELAALLKDDGGAKCVLVAGHSNTVPALLEALGAAEKIVLTDKEYDNLFVVVIGKGGDVVVQRLHYGVDSAP